MLSYRHTFHAGNHADVLKHCVLLHLLDYLTQKDKAFWYIDSHAGAASHDLRSDWAQKNAEFDSGISRLWKEKTLPPALAEYVALIRSFNADVADGALRHYPGSSRIALTKLRAGDRMRLFELHPSESQTLQHFYAGQSRQIQQQVQVQAMDGFDGLRAVLPPAPAALPTAAAKALMATATSFFLSKRFMESSTRGAVEGGGGRLAAGPAVSMQGYSTRGTSPPQASR
jgi:23S rRNA (adenine2030-N6)-methyltransferase